MSPTARVSRAIGLSVPRASGDEPARTLILELEKECSPRERG